MIFLAGVASCLVTGLMRFLVRFSVGLADLILDILRALAARRLPDLRRRDTASDGRDADAFRDDDAS